MHKTRWGGREQFLVKKVPRPAPAAGCVWVKVVAVLVHTGSVHSVSAVRDAPTSFSTLDYKIFLEWTLLACLRTPAKSSAAWIAMPQCGSNSETRCLERPMPPALPSPNTSLSVLESNLEHGTYSLLYTEHVTAANYQNRALRVHKCILSSTRWSADKQRCFCPSHWQFFRSYVKEYGV